MRNLGWWTTNYFIGPSFLGPGSVINQYHYASFFFSPSCCFPRSFEHRLHNRRIGYGGGGGNCILWYDGTIVVGVKPLCYVTPPVPY